MCFFINFIHLPSVSLSLLVAQLPMKSQLFHYQISPYDFWMITLFIALVIILVILLLLIERIKGNSSFFTLKNLDAKQDDLKSSFKHLNSNQITRILKIKRNKILLPLISLSTVNFWPLEVYSQTNNSNLWGKTGIIITLVLLLIPTLFAIALLFVKISNRLFKLKIQSQEKEARSIANQLDQLELKDIESTLLEYQKAQEYQLNQNQLSGENNANDPRGLLSINEHLEVPLVAKKKKAVQRLNNDSNLSKLVICFLISATFWLLFGTTIGEYVGIKFVAPDLEHISWLSFGRLRPVHTNSVFWGWASMAMIGLAYYVVPRVSNTKLFSIKLGWISLWLINFTVTAGTISLMAGINNGGGEYREYIWPIMLPFAVALVLTLINFYKTIARKTTREIYISNWYIVSAIIFTIVICLTAYLPFWQKGLGETIVQGYYMHQGVGMWFMLFTLGLVYYYLPQQLNRPIYSYSLGILAFWTQILFYTLIGTHHFVFSAIPWWLQTVAIVGSAGMAIPVFAGTTNFLMTFKGAWYKVRDSYILPFFLVGTIFYFTGSMQGTAEAFRETNLIWHFTDFTVAHSHLTMYGIICFFLWACIYAIVPRLTGHEAPQISVGAHFWLALLGMLMYTIPLMYGSTMKGIAWTEGKPFIDSVVMMAPYWLWRAIGGSLMWISHLVFAYNMYKMLAPNTSIDFAETIVRELEKKQTLTTKK